MEKVTKVTIILFCWLLPLQAQQLPNWNPPSENHPILIYGIKSFKNPLWVSVRPSVYKQREIDIVIENDDIYDCPRTIGGWKRFQLSPNCYNHIYVSDMVRELAYEMVDSTLKERIDKAKEYIPPFDTGCARYKNLLYRKIPYTDFLILYMTVDDYLDWAPRWHVDFCCKSPYNPTPKNTLFYRNDRKRHGLFLKFAIPLAPVLNP